MTKKQSLTTEQLGEAVIKSLERMSPKEKANVRKHLEKAFLKKPQAVMAYNTYDIDEIDFDHDPDLENNSILRTMLELGTPLTLAHYIDLAFMSNPPDGIEEDGEFLASVPDVILNGPRWVQ
jgi:hypothetical protein